MVKAFDLSSAFEGRVRAALDLSWARVCREYRRRCPECEGREHHWMEFTGVDWDGTEDIDEYPPFCCMHCKVRGEEGVIPKLLEGPL